MTKRTLPDELWLRLEEMRCSMAAEGFDLTDAQLLKIGRHYLRDPLPKKIMDLHMRAKRTGRLLSEVVNEGLNLRLDFQK